MLNAEEIGRLPAEMKSRTIYMNPFFILYHVLRLINVNGAVNGSLRLRLRNWYNI